MRSAIWGQFVKEILQEVKFRYDHSDIREELLEHMEELYEELREEGMDASVAEIMAVEYMGDAKEIGQALHKEHNPLLGWAWLIGKWLAAMFLVWGLLSIFPTAAQVYSGITTDYIEKTDSPLIYTVPLEEAWEVRGERIRLNEARYYKDGTLELRGDSLDWDRSNWNVSGLCRRMCVMDERGEQHAVEGLNGESISLGAGMFFRTQMVIAEIPEDTKEITLCYDGYTGESAVISLTEGREVAE